MRLVLLPQFAQSQHIIYVSVNFAECKSKLVRIEWTGKQHRHQIRNALRLVAAGALDQIAAVLMVVGQLAAAFLQPPERQLVSG